MYEEFTYLSANGVDRVVAQKWAPNGEIVGVVQFIHGMSEYMGIFDALAKYFNERGYVFCGIDLLGHGRTAGKNGYGYFAPQDGWKHMVTDCHELTLHLREEYPYSKLFVIGNSMGSFLARAYAEHYGEALAGLILVSTGGPNSVVELGRKFIHFYKKLRGEKHCGYLASILLFAGYNRRIKHPKSLIDWVSRDPEVIRRFRTDPACNFIFTLSAYEDLLAVYGEVSQKKWAEMLPKSLPVLFCSGAEDPLGNYGKGVGMIYDRLKEAGLEDVTLKIYPETRHDVLTECGHERAWTDLLDWIAKRNEI